MYCHGDCKNLNERKHVCERTGEKLTYMRFKGFCSYTVHEHKGVCEYERLLAQEKEAQTDASQDESDRADV